MKKIAFLYYRSWAYEILRYLCELQDERGDFIVSDVICPHGLNDDLSFLSTDLTTVHYVDPENSRDLVDIVESTNVKIIFCYSWSWMISQRLIDNFHCICLHPSRLPKYRGGSPIQNQVINGDLDSAVSVIRMSNELDAGPIYKQIAMNIDAPIKEVFDRMSSLGRVITKDLLADYLNGELQFQEQNHHMATVVKRRRPQDSCVTLDDMLNMRFKDVHRMVNILKDPYPNVYVNLKDCQINIKEIHEFKSVPKGRNIRVLSYETGFSDIDGQRNFIEVLDRFALVSQYTLRIF